MKKVFPFYCILISGCITDPTITDDRFGYVPMYADAAPNDAIGIESSKTTASAGKIYAYGSYAFQVDQYAGIHIISNAASSNAKKIAFLKIPLCTEIAIKQNFLYTNNLNDLVVFDISNPSQPHLVKRIEDAFPLVNQEYPPFNNVYFECPDPSKGIVIGWKEASLNNPRCRR